MDSSFGAQLAQRVANLIRKYGLWTARWARNSITKGSDSLADILRAAIRFWLSPSGRPVAIFTSGFIVFCLFADVAYAVFRVKTAPLKVHLMDVAHGCTECAPGQWKAVSSREIAEGAYSYATDPGCQPEDSWLKEPATFVRMIIFAPATLAIGTVIESYDLAVTKGIRSGLLGGTWLGWKLDGRNNATAECALLAFPVPLGAVVNGDVRLRAHSTRPKVSTLGPPQLPEKDQSDRGSWYDCPVDGGIQSCHGNYGSDARAIYKPTLTQTEEYLVFHTMIKNWYHDDGTANPREFTISVLFTPPSDWVPNSQDMNNSVKALSDWLF